MNSEEEDNKQQTVFSSLLEAIQTKQDRKDLGIKLRRFIQSTPSKTEIADIGIAIVKKKKESLHYREITDLLIILLKVLYKMSRRDNSPENQQKFTTKFNILKEKLNKTEVNKWIEGLKKQIQRLTNEPFIGIQSKASQSYDILVKDMKRVRQENDQIQCVRKIGLCFEDYSVVQSQIKDPKYIDKIVERVNTLKKKMDASASKQIDERLLQISNKYSFKCKNNIGILNKIQEYISQLSSKNDYLIKRREEAKLQQIEKIQSIASLRLKIEKYQQQQAITRQKKIKQQIQQNNISKDQMLTKTFLFESSIVLHKNHPQEIIFLRKRINEIAKIDGVKCKLLYSSQQPKSKQNFHLFFDNKPNILLIIKLKTGIIIGGFSHEEFKQNCSGKLGFLFNLSIMETYQLQKRSTITYDNYYIIFGNSQICIKGNDLNLFSNFGVSSAHFNCKGKQVSSFLNNEGSRDVQIETYQILQVLTQ